MYSNQLSYTSIIGGKGRHRTYDTQLFRLVLYQLSYLPMVAMVGFEPTTYRL